MSKVKALSKEKVEKLIGQLERSLELAKRLGDEPHMYAHSQAYGAAESAIEITLKQLKGEHYL